MNKRPETQDSWNVLLPKIDTTVTYECPKCHDRYMKLTESGECIDCVEKAQNSLRKPIKTLKERLMEYMTSHPYYGQIKSIEPLIDRLIALYPDKNIMGELEKASKWEDDRWYEVKMGEKKPLKGKRNYFNFILNWMRR